MESVGLLLSRVYLYMQEWEKAEKEADEVMRSTAATLSSIQAFTSDKAFLTEDNPEILFSQGHNSLVTDLVFMARPGDFCVTKELYDMYDENDCRRDCFFGKLLAAWISVFFFLLVCFGVAYLSILMMGTARHDIEYSLPAMGTFLLIQCLCFLVIPLFSI